MILSASILHAVLDCPAKAKWLAEHPDAEQGTALDKGRAIHAAVLGKGDEIVPISAKDYRTKLAQEARDAIRAEGKTPLLEHDWLEVSRIAGAVTSQLGPFTPTPFVGGLAEASIFWKEGDIQCRATPDWLSDDRAMIYDLKSTAATAHPGAFSRTLWEKGYALQEAWYRRAVQRVYGVAADFAFVVVEVNPPYPVSVVALDPESRAFADAQVAEGLRIWKQCVEKDYWPAYPERICYAELPAWQRTAWELRPYLMEAS